MRLVRKRDDAELLQLATRIPLRTHRRVKEFCVRNEVEMQSFIATALAEHLPRARRSGRRQPA